MVFMGADSLEGNEPLDDAVIADLAEMRLIGGAKTLEVFVQVHRHRGPTERYRFHWDDQGQKRAENRYPVRDMPSDDALIEFIKSSTETSGHRRQDHSMLVLWGHAYDFAFARSKTRAGVVDSIDFIELSGMLERLQDIMKERYSLRYGDTDDTRPTLDIIGFDVCDVATVEMACQLQPFAKYLLGSEIGIPIPGWPYDRILQRLANPKGRLMAPPEFGGWVVRRFCEAYRADTPVSLTFLDLTQATELRARAELLALALAVAIGDEDVRERIADLFKRSQTGEDRPYVDVVDLCLNLVREGGDVLVAEAARALGDLLLSPQGLLVGKSETGDGRPFIVEHGRNAGELARLNGVSLYAPHICNTDGLAIRSVYDRFVFAEKTVWSDLVHTMATQS